MKNKTSIVGLVLGLLLLAGGMSVQAQVTAFTYQGRLTDKGSPAQDAYDLRFTLYDEDDDQVGLPITMNNWPVVNGLFTVALDFGPNVFGIAEPHSLLVSVRPGAQDDPAPYIDQLPKQQVFPAPLAIYATKSGTAIGVAPLGVNNAAIQNTVITSAKIATNQVVKSLNGLKDDVTLAAGPNVTLTPSGNTLQISASGSAASGWSLSGNAVTGSGSFLGTLNSTPLLLKANGSRVLQLESVYHEPSTPFSVVDKYSVNVLGGSGANSITPGAIGATIGGGGSSGPNPLVFNNNFISDDFGTVGGGEANLAGNASGVVTDAPYATVGGGVANKARAGYSTVAGGSRNEISGSWSSIAGGSNNLISGQSSFIGGGQFNVASGGGSTVVGGERNSALASYSTVLGGVSNQTAPPAFWSTVLGGQDNEATAVFSCAAGRHAKANHVGSFVWADPQPEDFASSGSYQFCIRAQGGVRLNDDTSISFGSNVRQMVNLWGTQYGVGVQSGTLYHRSDSGYSWFKGGSHVDSPANTPGAGGTELMRLTSAGLTVNGRTTTRILTITGGADLAEPFPMSGSDIPKGALVVIDEQNAGRLKLSDQAYDSRVAGIVSGANGINPGVTLHQEGALEGGQNVALSGRVYALADAAHGVIKPGDLLTTSDTPGHAMKVSEREKAQGAIIGKAMTPLAAGKGLVLVLVSLQ